MSNVIDADHICSESLVRARGKVLLMKFSYPANNFTLVQRCHNMTFLLWQRFKVTLQQWKFVDSQIGCDNVVQQRCCITKLQPTYNLKIKIALNFMNVHSFNPFDPGPLRGIK